MQINRIAAPQFGLAPGLTPADASPAAPSDMAAMAGILRLVQVTGTHGLRPADSFRAEETQRLVALFTREIATAETYATEAEAAWRAAQALLAQTDPKDDVQRYRDRVDAMHARERDVRNARCGLEDVTAMYGPFIAQMTAALGNLPGTTPGTAPDTAQSPRLA